MQRRSLSISSLKEKIKLQTFLPYADFEMTAKCLDYRRLGKQRVEALQIWDVLEGIKHSKNGEKIKSNGWSNHPAVKMWKNNIGCLRKYGMVICQEWRNRGYKDTLLPVFSICENQEKPKWLGDESFHLSHRSNLMRKDQCHYSKFFKCSNNLEYIWPIEN
jgi:hypothetical protein